MLISLLLYTLYTAGLYISYRASHSKLFRARKMKCPAWAKKNNHKHSYHLSKQSKIAVGTKKQQLKCFMMTSFKKLKLLRTQNQTVGQSRKKLRASEQQTTRGPEGRVAVGYMNRRYAGLASSLFLCLCVGVPVAGHHGGGPDPAVRPGAQERQRGPGGPHQGPLLLVLRHEGTGQEVRDPHRGIPATQAGGYC